MGFLGAADHVGKVCANALELVAVRLDLGAGGAALGEEVADEHESSCAQQKGVDLVREQVLSVGVANGRRHAASSNGWMSVATGDSIPAGRRDGATNPTATAAPRSARPVRT